MNARLRSWFLPIVVAMSVASCGPSGASLKDVVIRDATIVNNAAALGLEAAQSTAELLYDGELRLTEQRAQAQPGATKETVRVAVAPVHERWKPIKELFPKARAVQSQLAAVVARGEDIATAATLVAELASQEAAIARALGEQRARLHGGM